MATTTPDLTKLKHVIAQQLHLYYETLEDGTNVLRHIRVHQRTLQMPAGGVTVDIVTPDGKIADGKVNSQSIEYDSVQLQDLSPEAREVFVPQVWSITLLLPEWVLPTLGAKIKIKIRTAKQFGEKVKNERTSIFLWSNV